MNERTVRYYVGRINEENGEQVLIQFDRFNGLPRSTNEMSSVNGFDSAVVVNRLVNWLNLIDDEIAGKHYYYYRLDSDNRTNLAIPEDAPEEVLRWFRDDEEDTGEDHEEEEPTE